MKIKQGTMINVKRVLGVLLAIMAAGFAFDIKIIQEGIMNYPIVSIGAIGLSAFFLLRSGVGRK